MKLVNLTPHDVNLCDNDGNLIETVERSGSIARVSTTPGALEDWGLSVPVAGPTTWGEIEGLPEPQEGVVYIASLFVAQIAKRRDVVSPGSGPNDNCIRDEQGRIAGVTRLIAHV